MLSALSGLQWANAVALATLFLATPATTRAQTRAEAARLPPMTITVYVSSRDDLCFDPGDVAAITKLATQEQERINAQGGVAGRDIRLSILDDQRDPAKTTENLRRSLADPATVAMIGMSNSMLAKAAFEALSKELQASDVPFLSSISVNGIYQPFPNVFTMQASQDDERLPVMAEFLRSIDAARVAYVGLRDGVVSNIVSDGLKQRLGASTLVANLRIGSQKSPTLDAAELSAIVAEIADKRPDVLVVGVGNSRLPQLIKELVKVGTTPALFITGRIDAIPAAITRTYPNALYQLAWNQLPEAYNDRLRRLIAKGTPESWIFEGRKIATAPGWDKGECRARPPSVIPDPLQSANLRAIEIGTQYADMIALIAAGARSTEPGADIPQIRQKIAQHLASAYSAGRGAFKGSFNNWSFHPQSRAAVRTPLVVMLPQGLGRTQLAPTQFLRIKDGSLRRIDTLYIDVDLIRTYRVDDNEKTFFAEFYLSMRNNPAASIERMDFANAYLDPRTNGRQLTIETLHAGGKSDAYPDGMRVYKVSGRFLFDPALASYPFDTQRFAIDLQPRRGDTPFIVQAPPAELRDQQVATDGWLPKSQYVAYDEDFVPVVDAYTHAPSIAPFYKASFVWLMKRQATDYNFRVVVPLGFILIVAYLAIFIPRLHFEAIVTIQVTALLSAVALYLSLPKLDADAATLSDSIFVFAYLTVSTMIMLSIARVNRYVGERRGLRAALGIVHIVLIPMMIAFMAYYVRSFALSDL